MAYGIASSDVLDICLVLCDGDLDTSIARMIKRVEDYQHARDCHFGVTETDFRMLMLRLAHDRGWINLSQWEHMRATLDHIPLRRWIQPMLAYNGVHFNDEGESWDTEQEVADYVEHNRLTREYFARPDELTREAVAAYLAGRGITAESVYRWTEQGQRERLYRCQTS